MTYSRPSRVKPPRPFGKINSRGGSGAGRSSDPKRVGVKAGTNGSKTLRCSICSAQSSLFIVQNNSRRGLQEHAVIVGNLFESPDEDAARLVQHLRFNPRRNQTGDLVVQGLAVNRNILVQDDQIHRQPLHAPIGVRLDQLPDDFDLFRVADAEQDDRRVAGNAIAPKAALAAPVVEQHAGVGPAGGVGINQRAGQTAIKLSFRLRGVELAQSHLAMGPGQIEGAVGHAGALIFFHMGQRGFPAFGHAKNKINDGGFMRAPK